METARGALALTQAAPDDDASVESGELSDKQALFAAAWAKTGNRAAAYRIAYSVKPTTLPATVWAAASRLAGMPKVEARYKELCQQATLETLMSVREFFQWQVDVATADPNEIVRVIARCCRYCHGSKGRYQWLDDDEYLKACVEALDAQQPVPTDDGGYGFNGGLEPNPICAHCYGVGIEQTIISDTTKLTGKARKLYAGAKQDRFGAIEVKLHDQQKAAEMVGRMLGAFKDLDLRTPEERERATQRAQLPANVTAEDAAKAYLTLIN